MPRLNILFVASECVPFAKTGGLADVVGALPLALAERGHDVRIVMPRYPTTRRFEATRLPFPLRVAGGGGDYWGAVWAGMAPHSNVTVYTLEHDVFFAREGVYGDTHGEFGDNLVRFSFLSRGAVELCKALPFVPDIVHAHDWPTALVPMYLNAEPAHSPFAKAASVLTIHNLGYQGWFAKEHLHQAGIDFDQFHALEMGNQINLLKGGITQSTVLNTVSARYAVEIQTSEGGFGLDSTLRGRSNDLFGILNGIDDHTWNPASDPHLEAWFDAENLAGKAECKASLQRELGLTVRDDVTLIGMVSRLAHQKGVDVVAEALDRILAFDVQFVLLGSGEPWAEQFFRMRSAHSDRFRAVIGLDDRLAHRIFGGSDLFLMPSRYEPCGLGQLYAQRYGCLPVVRAVGGLDDTVENYQTGFKFDELTVDSLVKNVYFAVHTHCAEPAHFRQMQHQSMTKPVGWSHASRQYEALYRYAISRKAGKL